MLGHPLAEQRVRVGDRWEQRGGQPAEGDAASGEDSSFSDRLAMMLAEQDGHRIEASTIPKLYRDRFGTRLPLTPGKKLKHLLADAASEGVCVIQEQRGQHGNIEAVYISIL